MSEQNPDPAGPDPGPDPAESGPTDGPPPGGFADPEMGGEPGPEPGGGPDPYYGLRNSTPPVSPSEIGNQLDVQAAWWQHYGAGFVKQSNSEGVEAWQHYLMGTAILLLTLKQKSGGSGSESSESESDPLADL